MKQLLYLPLLAAALAGCERAPEAAPKAALATTNNPAVTRAIAAKKAALEALLAERKPLAERQKQLFKEFKGHLSALQTNSEWQALHQRVTALNARFEALKTAPVKVEGR